MADPGRSEGRRESLTSPAAEATGSPTLDLSQQSKEFLIQRVQALERQLLIRNKDCARLLQDRQALAECTQKCESQREVILALKEELAVARAERDSAREYAATLRQLARDQEFQEVKGKVASATAGPSAAPTDGGERRPSIRVVSVTSCDGSGGSRPVAPGGTVVKTASGTQILYDSSDISSIGFQTNAPRPYDFLGGPGAQAELLRKSQRPAHTGSGGSGEEEEVQRLMRMAKDEAEIDKRNAELGDLEEQQLMNRLNALRGGTKK